MFASAQENVVLVVSRVPSTDDYSQCIPEHFLLLLDFINLYFKGRLPPENPGRVPGVAIMLQCNFSTILETYIIYILLKFPKLLQIRLVCSKVQLLVIEILLPDMSAVALFKFI